jgi:hypothetical protein
VAEIIQFPRRDLPLRTKAPEGYVYTLRDLQTRSEVSRSLFRERLVELLRSRLSDDGSLFIDVAPDEQVAVCLPFTRKAG